MEYNIEGMECTGCANTVQKKLSEVAGVTAVTVDFATKKATVETDREIPFEALEKALEGTHYSIHQASNSEGSGVFYCPMHCEGDKTYDHPGDCPICGMHLVKQVGGAQQQHHLPLITQLERLGYQRRPLQHIRPADLCYYRENQVVARELLVMEVMK